MDQGTRLAPSKAHPRSTDPAPRERSRGLRQNRGALCPWQSSESRPAATSRSASMSRLRADSARPLLRHLLRPVHRPPQKALPALMGLVRLAFGPLDPGHRLVADPPPRRSSRWTDRSIGADGCSESMAKPRSRVPYTLGRLARCALHRPAPTASGHPERLISSLHTHLNFFP